MRTFLSKTGRAQWFIASASLLCALALWQPGEAHAQWSPPDQYGHISNTNTGGNVGVGTTTPAAPLTVKSDTNVMPLLVRGTNSNAVSFGVLNDQPASKGWAFQVAGLNNLGGVPVGSFIIRQATNDFNTFVVSPMGNVGVGALAPTSQLHVHNPAGFGAMRVSGNGAAVLNFRDETAGANAKLYQWRSEGGVFRMALVNDDESGYVQQHLLVATAGGNVGVGTANPARTLSLNGPTAPAIGISTGGAERATFGVATAAGQWFGGSATNDVALRSDATDLWVGTSSGARPIRFVTNNSQRVVIDGAGNVGIGTTMPAAGYKLDVNGGINSSGHINAGGNITATGSIAAKYQDVAEWVPSKQRLAAGTVVVLDAERTNHVLASSQAYDTRVAGVVSEQPGVILGEGGEGKLMVATTGRVRVKVDATRAPVKVGDLLVTSEVEGVAMKSVPLDFRGTPIHRPGTIIGKALEPLEQGTGEILILLSLQ